MAIQCIKKIDIYIHIYIHIIISIDAEEEFGKIQYTQELQQTQNRGDLPLFNKQHPQNLQLTSYIIITLYN